MAQSITDSFKELEKQLDSLTSKFKKLGLGVQQREKFDKSKSLAKAEALVENNAYLTSAYGMLRHVKDIQKAQLYMKSYPDKFKTPDRFIAWENKVRQRSKESFARSQEVRDKILSIENPEAYHKIQLIRKYGDVEAGKLIKAENIEKIAKEHRREIDKEMSITDPEKYKKRRYHEEYGWFGSQRILAAEQNERIRLAKIGIANRKAAGRYAYNLATMSEKDRKFHDLTMLFGSGEQGRRLAALKIQSDQDEEDAKERRLRDSRRSIAVRRMQIDAYKKFPWVKTLVDAGIIQKKELPKIAKNLNMMSKTPIIGSMIKHPAIAGVGMATALMSLVGRMLSMESSANKTVTQWESMAAIYGKPSDYFDEVMKKAGINEYAERVKAWGNLSMRYGNPDVILQTLGSAIAMGAKGISRGTVANILGLSEDVATGAMIAAGGYKPSEAAERNSILAEIQRTEKEGFKSGSSLRTKSRALTLKMLGWAGEAELESHGLSWLDLLSGPFMFNAPLPVGSPDTRFSEWDKARRAAESAEEYERNKGSTYHPINSEATSAGNQVSFNINSVNVEADNYQEFIQSVASEAGMRYNIDVMKWADSRRVKV